MFDDVTLGPRILANPTQTQALMIQALQDRMGGNVVIPDVNNAFTFLMDGSTSLCAQFVQQEDKKYEALYKLRSRTAAELYPFLSDYDYVNLMASPASIKFRLIVLKSWIVDNAVSYDSGYSKLVIPATSSFQVGSLPFGMYYPIQIMVNKTSSVTSATYDLSTTNPLFTASTNQLDSVSTYTYSGQEYLDFVFDAWQFATVVKNEIATTDTGFTKTYVYTDQFYAARTFTLLNGTWVEMACSLSQMAYDPQKATVLITPLIDTNTLTVEIPQIYFQTGLVGQQFKIFIYTTRGAITATISDNDALNTQANFDPSSSIYSAPLAQIPSMNIVPYNTTTVSGGGDPMTFDEFRNAVVYNELYTGAPVSNMQLNAAVSKYGFSLLKYIDNITDRILFAGTALNFSDGSTVPTVVSGILLNNTYITGDPSTIIPFSDNLVTILPSTIFRYDANTDIVTPCLDADVQYLKSLAVEDLVTVLNTTTYLKQPYHLVLYTGEQYPTAKTFNLMNPKMTSVIFEYEDAHSASQLSVTNAIVTHQNEGVGGYTIQVGVVVSAALANVDPSQLIVLLYTTDQTGNRMHYEAGYSGTTNNVLVFTVTIPTTYHITLDGYITSTALDTYGNSTQLNLSLDTTFDVRLGVAPSLEPTVTQDNTLAAGVDSMYLKNWLIVSQQTLAIQFGEDMSALLYNIVNTTWSSQVYSTYTEDVYQTYSKDGYLFSADGTIVSQVVTSGTTKSLQLVKIYSKGDPVLSGAPITTIISQTQSIPTNVINVENVQGYLIGMIVSGIGIQPGTTITGIDSTAQTLTLSNTPTAVVSGNGVSALSPLITQSIYTAQAEASPVITLTDATSVVPGMTVYGLNIPEGTTVQSIDSDNNTNTITLSSATTAPLPAGALVYIVNLTGPKLYLHRVGDLKVDASGASVLVNDRSNVFRVTAPLFDARLFASQDATDVAFMNALPALISTTAHQLDTVRQNMFERTSLYYVPYKTLGTATFGIGDGNTSQLSLALSFTVTYYVTDAVKNNTSLTETMTSQTIELLENYVTQGSIAIFEIYELLNDNLGGNFVSVDIGGINNDPSLQTLVVETSQAVPSIARVIDQAADGTLYLSPDITVNYKLTAT